MENQALISVIIPVYNVEEYLRECIDSVINQTYTNLEIILVDDGSTDSSGKICDEYAEKDSRVSVIHQKNGGLSVARNTGLELSTGEYVYFLDSDDYIDVNAIETLVLIAEKNNSDIVFFDAIGFGDSKSNEQLTFYVRNNSYPSCGGKEMLDKLHKNREFHSAVPLLLLRRKFLVDKNLIFIPGIYHEDMAFTFEAFCLAEVVSQCAKSLYYRRYRQSSIMTSKKSQHHFNGMVTVYYHILDFSKEHKITECYVIKKHIARCAYNCFNIYEQLNLQDKNVCKNLLKKIKYDVLNNNAYGDYALKMRCYGKGFWFIYKIFEKTVGRLLKGKNE